MTKFISEKSASNGLLIILSLFIVFHLLILSRIIPFDMVWGGKIEDTYKMTSFETAALIINIIMLVAVAIKANLLKIRISPTIIKIILWAMFILFLLNTVGNILSANEFEKFGFTPLTILLSLFSLRLAISKTQTTPPIS